jgi:hypothetical protein
MALVLDVLMKGELDLSKSIGYMLLFGIYLGVINARMFIKTMKRKLDKTELKEIDFASERNMEVVSAVSKNELLEKIKTQTFFKRGKVAETENGFVLRLPPNDVKVGYFRFGHILTVIIQASENNEFTYTLNCKTKFNAPISAYRENMVLENLDKMKKLLVL